MKRVMTLGGLREVLIEAMALHREPDAQEDHWTVTADAMAMMGFDVRRDNERGGAIGYTVKGVWAPLQALKHVDAKSLSTALMKTVPEGVEANDMLEVLKTMRPKTTKSGVTLVPAPDLQRKVAHIAAAMAYRHFANAKIDLVVTPQSSSAFASYFGQMLAGYLKAELVPEGVLKSKNIRLEMPDHVKGTQTGKDAEKSLERWQKKLAAGETPSLRSSFKPSMRQHVKGFMDVGNNMSAHLGKPVRILVADDIVTTGSTQLESKRVLEEWGFEVVGMVAAFKEQSTR